MAKNKKNEKATEEEFDDIFEGDEDDDTFEDGDEDEFDSEEEEGEDDGEFDEEDDEEFEDDEELDESVEDAVENSLQENSHGPSKEDFEKFASDVTKRLEGIEKLLKAKPAAEAPPAAVKPPKATKVEEKPAKVAAPAEEPKRGRGRPAGSTNKVAEEQPAKAAKPEAPKTSALKKKDAAIVLAAMNQKDDRKGTDANKFARILSKKKFEGKVSPEQIMAFLTENKHVFGTGVKAGTFKR